MKRTRKPHFSLNKNTVRSLSTRQLNRAIGAAPSLITCSSSDSLGAEHTCSPFERTID